MQAESRLALAVVGAQGVHTAVLAAPIVHLALVNICKNTREKWTKIRGVDRSVDELRNIYPLLSYSGSEERKQTRLVILLCLVRQATCEIPGTNLQSVNNHHKSLIIFFSQHKPSTSGHPIMVTESKIMDLLIDSKIIDLLIFYTSLLVKENLKFLSRFLPVPQSETWR